MLLVTCAAVYFKDVSLLSNLLGKLLRYLDHHVSRQRVTETHIKGCRVKKRKRTLGKELGKNMLLKLL